MTERRRFRYDSPQPRAGCVGTSPRPGRARGAHPAPVLDLTAGMAETAVGEDRRRIAGDLHDTVIQRLFAAGLALQCALRTIDDAAARTRVEHAVTLLDETSSQLRCTILDLEAPGLARDGLRVRIAAAAADAADGLGFAPAVALSGPIDTTVGPVVAGHLLAVLREALANVTRHAGARCCSVTVAVDATSVLLEVTDDGAGPGRGARAGGHGTANTARRAAGLGGAMSLTHRRDGPGACLAWHVPITPGGGAATPDPGAQRDASPPREIPPTP